MTHAATQPPFFWKNTKVFITGHTGSWLFFRLQSLGEKVRVDPLRIEIIPVSK